jgi:hypothetical protein
MEAKCFSETSADFQGITKHVIPEDRNVHNYTCENNESGKYSVMTNSDQNGGNASKISPH